MAVGMAVVGATDLPWCNCTSSLPPPPVFLPRSPPSAPLPPGVQLMRSGSTNERPSGWIAFRSGFTRDVFGFASDRTRGRSGSTRDLKGKDFPGTPVGDVQNVRGAAHQRLSPHRTLLRGTRRRHDRHTCALGQGPVRRTTRPERPAQDRERTCQVRVAKRAETPAT